MYIKANPQFTNLISTQFWRNEQNDKTESDEEEEKSLKTSQQE